MSTVKTSQKKAINRHRGCNDNSRSLTGEEENDAFERIEKECQRLAQDPSYYDDKTEIGSMQRHDARHEHTEILKAQFAVDKNKGSVNDFKYW